MSRVVVSLKTTEREALRRLAEQELREPRLQAALIIRRELERRGLLPAEQTPAALPERVETES